MQRYAKLQMRTEEKDMSYNIAVIPGDGIGPEIVREAQKVLDAAGKKYGFELKYTEVLMGGASIDVHGVPLTDEAIATAKASDAVLMGSIGGDAKTSPWYKLAPNLRPEAGLLKIRKELNLFANLRPAYLYEELKEACIRLGGQIQPRLARADVTARIPAFPFFPVLLQFWDADDEFPPQIKIMWDDQTMRYLNFETTYYLQGDLLARLLEKVSGIQTAMR